MKGIYLEAVSRPTSLRTDLPEPVLRAGGVIVRMMAAPVLSYTREVFKGSLNYLFPVPFIPGNSGVGKIEAVAEDVFHLHPDQLVNIDPRLTPHTAANPAEADSILIGLTASTPSSQSLQNIWRNGTYAQKALVPAECLTPLEAVSNLDPAQLSLLSHIAVPYGGLLRGEFRAGETLVVNGATGSFGARAVLVALALGATRVVAVGRDQRVLATLADLDSRRVVTIALQPDGLEKNTARIVEATGGSGADFYFDMLGRAQEPDSILACLGSVRHRGTIVFMGGVRIPIPLPYAEIMRKELTLHGNFMFPRGAIAELVGMIAAGTLSLDKIALQRFPLDKFEAALDAAEKSKGLESVALLLD